MFHDIDHINGCVATNYKIQLYLDVLNLLLALLIPFSIMTISTYLIWYELSKKRTNLQENRKRFEKDLQLLKTLCFMDVYFLLCNLPYCIYIIVYDLLQINAIETLGFFIVCIFSYIFSSFNFFIYFFFNKRFFEYFLSMIRYSNKKKLKVALKTLREKTEI